MKNKKNKIFILVIVATSLLAQGSIRAGEVPESTVVIQFTPGDANVDPLDPDEPIAPPEEGGGGAGGLALNYVSPLYFEEQFISASDRDYPTVTLKPYIQVTDLRGTGTGWIVSARASKFTNEITAGDALLGATITFKDSSCISPTMSIPPPVPKTELVLPADGTTESEVVSAAPNTGMGTWLTRWYTSPVNNLNESVILSVPGGAALKGKNTATITWFFSDVPVD